MRARAVGPSPRMWGLPRIQSRRRTRPPVHPHACGVYLWYNETIEERSAVHPHACGVYLNFRIDVNFLSRSIPTHVGFTALSLPFDYTVFGPSPRMWGLRSHPGPGGPRARSIPTHVGFTVIIRTTSRTNLGPSPRMWGLPLK